MIVGGLVMVLAVVSAVILATASSGRNPIAIAGPPTSSTTTPPEAQLAASMTAIPPDHATNVPLNATVTVKTGKGKFASVVVASNPGGVVLPGRFNSSGTEWSSDSYLLATTQYVIEAVARSQPGVSATTISSFSTLTPQAEVTTSVAPGEGQVLGAGQPIVMTFNRPVTSLAAQRALFQHLTVSTSPVIALGGFWLSPTEVHLRPQRLWPAGERVTLSYDLGGWDVGGGAWGDAAGARRLTVHAARVSTLDLSTRKLTVSLDDRTVAVYPVTNSPSSSLSNGIHLVLSRTLAQSGMYWLVTLSDSGSALCAVSPLRPGGPGTCASMSLADAERFYYFSRTGDVVIVTGSKLAASPADQGTVDWSMPWSTLTPVAVRTG